MENVKDIIHTMKDDSEQKLLNSLSELDPSQHAAPESAVLMSDFKWCDSATALMLKLYKEKQTKFNNPHVKKKVVWREIAEIMQQHGYVFDADRCERKFLNLKTSYRNTIQHNCMTGNISRTCAFFAELHEIFQMQLGMDDGKSPVNMQPSPVRLVANSNNVHVPVQVISISDGKESRSSVTPSAESYRYSAQRQHTTQISTQPQTSSESHSNVPYSIPNSSPNSQFHVSASMFLEASAQRNNTSESKQRSHGQPQTHKISDNHSDRRQLGNQSLTHLPQRNPSLVSNSPTTAQSSHPTENGRHYQNTSVIDLCNDRKRSTDGDTRPDRVKKRKNSSDLQWLLDSFEKYREEQKVREDDRMRLMKEFHDEEMKVMNRFLDIIQQCVQGSDD